jgi:hypothetical protein
MDHNEYPDLYPGIPRPAPSEYDIMMARARRTDAERRERMKARRRDRFRNFVGL